MRIAWGKVVIVAGSLGVLGCLAGASPVLAALFAIVLLAFGLIWAAVDRSR